MPSHETLFHLSGNPVACSRDRWGETWDCLSKLCAGRKEPWSIPLLGEPGAEPKGCCLLCAIRATPEGCRAGVQLCQLCQPREPRLPSPAPHGSASPSPAPPAVHARCFPRCLAKSMSADVPLHARGLGGMETRKECSSTQRDTWVSSLGTPPLGSAAGGTKSSGG